MESKNRLIQKREKANKIPSLKRQKMIDLDRTIFIITLDINGINIPIKGQRLSGWIRKKKSNNQLHSNV